MSRTHVFVGASLDGFIAGPNDELDWLGGGGSPADAQKAFDAFFSQIGAVLMGRRTYDIVCGMNGPWLYGDTPLLVATSRAMQPSRPSVQAVSGSIVPMVERAKQIAAGRDVYVDGGRLIRAALDAELIDAVTVAIIPVIIGNGIPLFAGAVRHHRLRLIGHETMGGAAVQLKYEVQRNC